jgi:hypothetical protein
LRIWKERCGPVTKGECGHAWCGHKFIRDEQRKATKRPFDRKAARARERLHRASRRVNHNR